MKFFCFSQKTKMYLTEYLQSFPASFSLAGDEYKYIFESILIFMASMTPEAVCSAANIKNYDVLYAHISMINSIVGLIQITDSEVTIENILQIVTSIEDTYNVKINFSPENK